VVLKGSGVADEKTKYSFYYFHNWNLRIKKNDFLLPQRLLNSTYRNPTAAIMLIHLVRMRFLLIGNVQLFFYLIRIGSI
jgi:hypothetical protein